MQLILFRRPKKLWMFSDGLKAMCANPSRISLSSNSVANSSFKKGLMIVHRSLSSMIFLRVICELSHVLAEPLRARLKLSNATLSVQLLADIILSARLMNSLAEIKSLSFWPQNLSYSVCWTLRVRTPSAPWMTRIWAIGTLLTSWLTGLIAGGACRCWAWGTTGCGAWVAESVAASDFEDQPWCSVEYRQSTMFWQEWLFRKNSNLL